MTPFVYDIGLNVSFRGITRRSGILFEGPAGWAEWSPFPEYDDGEAAAWLAAALEAAELGHPEPLRDSVEVNAIVPALPPAQAAARAVAAGCRTVKIKVAARGQGLADDIARVAAVREALPDVALRVDANGAWSLDEAAAALRALAGFSLEYAEQPCATVEELAGLRVRLARAGIEVPVAADESIRRSGDPERVAALDAADVAVLKVQPLGGVRRCLELAERLGMPVVVSSALESSVGIAAGVALAAALPQLPYACGLNTVALLAQDVVDEPLIAVNGAIEVRRVVPSRDDWRAADELDRWWHRRLSDVEEGIR